MLSSHKHLPDPKVSPTETRLTGLRVRAPPARRTQLLPPQTTQPHIKHAGNYFNIAPLAIFDDFDIVTVETNKSNRLRKSEAVVVPVCLVVDYLCRMVARLCVCHESFGRVNSWIQRLDNIWN